MIYNRGLIALNRVSYPYPKFAGVPPRASSISSELNSTCNVQGQIQLSSLAMISSPACDIVCLLGDDESMNFSKVCI